MPDAVFDDVHTKVLVLADISGSGGLNMVSGSVYISGSKLYVQGNAGPELVTSS